MLLKNPIPPPPGAKADHSPSREADSLRAQGEAFDILSALIAFLDQYEPTQITAVDGRIYETLARDLGDVGISSDPFPFQITDASNAINGVRVRVRLGQVQTGNTSYLTPTGMTFPSDAPAYYLAVAADGYVVLGVDINPASNWDGTGCDLSISASVPVNTSTRAYFKIGIVLYLSGAITGVANTIKNDFQFITIGQLTSSAPITYVNQFLLP